MDFPVMRLPNRLDMAYSQSLLRFPQSRRPFPPDKVDTSSGQTEN